MHICFGKPGHRRFRKWLVAWKETNHHLNICTLPMGSIETKLWWISNQNRTIFIEENEFENVVCKMTVILSWSQCVYTTCLAGFATERTTMHVVTYPCLWLKLIRVNKRGPAYSANASRDQYVMAVKSTLIHGWQSGFNFYQVSNTPRDYYIMRIPKANPRLPSVDWLAAYWIHRIAFFMTYGFHTLM